MVKSFYKSPRWKAKRAAILKRDGYLCRYYIRFGRKIDAEVVHHIFPRDKYPEYAWCNWNLISLSRAAHNLMHDRTTDELTKTGKELLRRTARKNNIAIPMEYSI